MPNLLELPETLRKAVLRVWRTDRSLAKSYAQIRRAEQARARLEAIHAARLAARCKKINAAVKDMQRDRRPDEAVN